MFFAVGLNLVYVEGVVIYVARVLVDGSLGECDPNVPNKVYYSHTN